MIGKGKKGKKFEIKVGVDKVPSSGKYRVQGSVQVTYQNGQYDTIARQSLTFNMRKDAETFAKGLRKSFKQIAMDHAKM